MNEISTKAKDRFCKDCAIPIKVFQEPYFTDRLNLFDSTFDTLKKWELFVSELSKYKNEQDYFEEYNRVKDTAINSIKETEAYQNFNSMDMNQYAVKNNNLPGKDIFKPSNDGRTFISIDIKKANFSSLYEYDPDIFVVDGKSSNTWEDFIGHFTDNQHIITSKYIRQVILGNCNPRRHIAYEKHLTDVIADILFLVPIISRERVVFFSNDEIVFDVTDMLMDECVLLCGTIRNIVLPVPVKVEGFVLHAIKGTHGYYKKNIETDELDFKCLDSYMFPFVIREANGEEIQDSDKVFFENGLLATYIETPKIEL